MNNKRLFVLLLLLPLIGLINADLIQPGVNVECTSGKMTASFADSYVQGLTKYTAVELQLLNDPSRNGTGKVCKAERGTDGDWLISSNLQDCVYSKRVESEKVKYSFRAVVNIKLPKTMVVSDEQPKSVEFSCVYSKIVKVQSFGIGSSTKDLSLEVLSDGKYDIELKIFKDDQYTDEFSPKGAQNVFSGKDRIYVDLSTELQSTVLKVDKCEIASDASFESDVVSLIDGGCPMQAGTTSFPMLSNSGKSSRFHFDASKLLKNDDQITTSSYLRCHVTLCNTDRQQDCFVMPVCGNRNQRKRDLHFNRICEDLNCEDFCISKRESASCACAPGKMLNSDLQTCSITAGGHLHHAATSHSQIFFTVVAIFVCFAVVLGVVLVFLKFGKAFCIKGLAKQVDKSEFEPIMELDQTVEYCEKNEETSKLA